jgi:DNA-binding response OmpR family regulator
MARILVVDDERHILEVVRAYLARDGHEVLVAIDGDSALERARSEAPDLVILDVMLPRRSGFDVLRDLRSGGAGPAVIMLTARDDVIDRVAGLEMGADDYLSKPFEPRELVARVSAVLRRATHGPIANQVPTEAAFADLVVDAAAREVRRGDTSVELTRVEFDLFMALIDRPGTVLTRAQLGERAFGEAFDAYDRTIDSHIKNLRRKLGPNPAGGSYVETVRGVGYRAVRP